MGFLRVEKFCHCIGLRTGGLIWGFVSLFLNICLLFFCLAMYMMRDKVSMHSKKFSINPVFFGAGAIIVSVYLLYAIFRKKPAYMIPAIILNFGVFGLFLLAIVLYGVHGDFSVVIFLLPFLVWFWHVSAVLFSLREKIKKEKFHVENVMFHTDDTSASPQSAI